MKLPDQVRLRQWLARACVISMICLSITAPAIVLSSALPYFKIEQLLIPAVLMIYLWLVLAGIARPLRLNGMFAVGLVYFICNAVSTVYGANVLGHTVVLRDYYELPKVWLPVAFFTIAYEAELTESGLRRLLSVFSFAALAVCLYAWGQFFGLGIAYRLNPYYSSGGHIDQALEYARRVYSTMGNPNALGALMSWCVIVYVLASLYRVGSWLLNALVALACLITMVMTGSRYGIVTLSIGMVLIFALSSAASRRNLPKFALLLATVPVFVWTYQTVANINRRTLQRYETLSDPLQVDSLRQRLDELWPGAWADFSKSPLVGHGPGKSLFQYSVGETIEGIIDSEYLSVLRQFGIIGFAGYLAYYIFPLSLIWKGQQASRSLGLLVERAPATLMTLQAGFVMGVLALAMNVGMGTFYTPFLQGFLWLWLGVAARSAAIVRGVADHDSNPRRRVFSAGTACPEEARAIYNS